MPDIQTHWSILHEAEPMQPPIWLWVTGEADEGGLSLEAEELRKLLVPALEEDDTSGVSPEEAVQRHWYQFVEILYDGDHPTPEGYQTLTALRDQIDARVTSIAERQAVVDDQLEYIRLLFKKHVVQLQEKMDSPPEWSMTLRVGGMSIETVAGWQELDASVHEVFGDIARQQALNLTLDESEIEKAGISLQNLRRSDFDLFGSDAPRQEGQLPSTSDDREPVDYDYGSTPVTWEDALEELIETHSKRREKLRELSRARELLEFRRAVLENVLYRFEMLGRVQQLSARELKEFTEDIPSHYAKKVVEVGEDIGVEEGRQAILKEAAERLNIGGSKPHSNLQRKLGSLYPKGKSNRPKKRKKVERAEKLVENCKKYVHYKNQKQDE